MWNENAWWYFLFACFRWKTVELCAIVCIDPLPTLPTLNPFWDNRGDADTSRGKKGINSILWNEDKKIMFVWLTLIKRSENTFQTTLSGIYLKNPQNIHPRILLGIPLRISSRIPKKFQRNFHNLVHEVVWKKVVDLLLKLFGYFLKDFFMNLFIIINYPPSRISLVILSKMLPEFTPRISLRILQVITSKRFLNKLFLEYLKVSILELLHRFFEQSFEKLC